MMGCVRTAIRSIIRSIVRSIIRTAICSIVSAASIVERFSVENNRKIHLTACI